MPIRPRKKQAPGKKRPTRAARAWVAIACSLLFLSLVAALVASGRVPWPLFMWYVIISAITYRIYVVDKHNLIAKEQGEPGIQLMANRRLHLLALIGGWPGAWIGQRIAQYK